MNSSQIKFRIANETDMFGMISMLADDPIGTKRENLSQASRIKYKLAFEEILKDSNNQLIVVEKENELIGMMQLTFIPSLTYTGSWRCQIEGVRIKPAHRNSGIGNAMIEFAIGRAKKRNCAIVQLTSDKQRPEAIRFYNRLGFTASHEGMKIKLKEE